VLNAVSRDVRNFAPDPESFMPERWLGGETNAEPARLHRDVLAPFSIGAHLRCSTCAR